MPERVIVLGTPKPEVELADVFRLYADEYLSMRGASTEQHKVMRDITHCRTAALGGHVDECDHCKALRISYNS